MKPIETYLDIVSENDYHGMSYNNTGNLVYLIQKFLRNNNDSVPDKKVLNKMKLGQLFIIWKSNMPKDLWKGFI
jgi:hypothetical protein